MFTLKKDFENLVNSLEWYKSTGEIPEPIYQSLSKTASRSIKQLDSLIKADSSRTKRYDKRKAAVADAIEKWTYEVELPPGYVNDIDLLLRLLDPVLR